MGEIFLGRQTGASSIDRLVVLKTLLPEFAEQLESIEAFLDEARVSATLNHPNIVTVYEVGKWSGTYFLAMEYIQGDSIGALISSVCQMDESVPLDVAAAIAHDAAIALDHAHVATDPAGEPLRIVHRDISLRTSWCAMTA